MLYTTYYKPIKDILRDIHRNKYSCLLIEFYFPMLFDLYGVYLVENYPRYFKADSNGAKSTRLFRRLSYEDRIAIRLEAVKGFFRSRS